MQMGISSGLRWCCSGQAVPSGQVPCSQRGHTARLVESCLQGNVNIRAGFDHGHEMHQPPLPNAQVCNAACE